MLRRVLFGLSAFILILLVFIWHRQLLVARTSLDALGACNSFLYEQASSQQQTPGLGCNFVGSDSSFQHKFYFLVAGNPICFEARDYVVWMTRPVPAGC